MSISPPLSRNLRFFLGMLGMCQVELLTDQEFYASFMKLPAEPSGAWARGRIIQIYPISWWTQHFETGWEEWTHKFPHSNDIREMVISHFEQLVSEFIPPESHCLTN
jgi:hypothetical protein